MWVAAKGRVENRDGGLGSVWFGPGFHAVLTCRSPKQTLSRRFYSRKARAGEEVRAPQAGRLRAMP